MNLSMIGDNHSLKYWDTYITLQDSGQPGEGSFKKNVSGLQICHH